MPSVIRGQDNFTTDPSARGMVRLNTANGYGSVNTAIRRFTNLVTNQGTDISYADSATLGASFTVNAAGTYTISYTDQLAGVGTVGLSLNDPNLTAAIGSSTPAAVLAATTIAAANYASGCSWTGCLPAGSVVRVNGGANNAGNTPALVQFTMSRVD